MRENDKYVELIGTTHHINYWLSKRRKNKNCKKKFFLYKCVLSSWYNIKPRINQIFQGLFYNSCLISGLSYAIVSHFSISFYIISLYFIQEKHPCICGPWRFILVPKILLPDYIRIESSNFDWILTPCKHFSFQYMNMENNERKCELFSLSKQLPKEIKIIKITFYIRIVCYRWFYY